MPRSNSSVPRHRRHRKVVKQAKGYYGTRSRNYRTAMDAIIKAMSYAYRDRRQRKRQMRQLWIARINAAVRQHGMSYSHFVHAMKQNNIELNRKMLADLAITEPQSFETLIKAIS